MANFKRDMNRMTIVGKLHSMNLKEKPTKKGDKLMIIGNVSVEVVRNKEVNVIEMKVLTMDSDKNYKAMQTVMNEYKTISQDGRDNADVVKIQGNVLLNEYEAQDGTIKSFNVLNARFFHRLSPSEYEGDEATLTLGGIYMGNKEVTDADGLPIGEREIDIYSMTYNSTTKENDKVNELKGLRMTEELFGYFETEYAIGDKLAFEIEIHRGAVVEEVEEKKGFGKQPTIQHNSYRWGFEIVGGTLLTELEEDILEEMKKLRKQQKAEVGGVPMSNEGKSFGKVNNNPPIDSNFDDLPF